MSIPKLNHDGMTMQERAATIAALIQHTNSDDRHRLFHHIAEELRLRTQNFQAKHFEIAEAREMGDNARAVALCLR